MASAAVVLLAGASPVQAKDHPSNGFQGPYAGVEISRQNVIGGSLVRGVDTLAQDERAVASILAGYRHEIGERLVVGVEASVGVGDQSLRLDDAVQSLSLRYKNGSQWSFGAIVGWALGSARDTLVFGYVSETKRSFEVTGTVSGAPLRQTDKQGLLRYGAGVEHALNDNVRIRASAGTSRADFGDRPTNIRPGHPVDVSLGLLYEF